MRATDELRRMLDERGVEWTYGDGTVSYTDKGRWFHAWAYNDGAMCVSMGYLTPEQAIAATLGGACEACPQMDNPDSFIRHLMECETREKFYAVKTWSDLDDIGVSYIERKLYRTREEAERKAEEVEAWSDDVGWYASVEEFEVVEP